MPAENSQTVQAKHTTMAEEMAWSMNEWRWDPFRMVAVPTSLKEEVSSSTSKGVSHLGATIREGEKGSAAVAKKGAPICQVEGCDADLTTLKEYHLRYKICEVHLKVRTDCCKALQ